jgi:seryl-tRNA synthetase
MLENTNNEVNNEVSNREQMESFVRTFKNEAIVDEMIRMMDEISDLKTKLENMMNDRDYYRTQYSSKITEHNSVIETVTEFIKENIDGADASLLRGLADDLDIALKKTVMVTFNVAVELEVELELDEDEPTEYDFEVDVRYTGNGDVEDSPTTNIDDFDVEEQ